MYKEVDHSTRQIQVYTNAIGAILTVRVVVRFKVVLERDRGSAGFISSGFLIWYYTDRHPVLYPMTHHCVQLTQLHSTGENSLHPLKL